MASLTLGDGEEDKEGESIYSFRGAVPPFSFTNNTGRDWLPVPGVDDIDSNRESGKVLEAANETLKKTQDLVQEQKVALDDFKRKDLEPLKIEIETLKKDKISIIETLGIFVALFTFISVDIQFFRADITFLSLIGFTLITLGGLTLFVILLHISLRTGFDWKSYSIILTVFLVVVSLLGVGVWFVGFDGFQKVLRKDFFLEKDRETKGVLSVFEQRLATSTKSTKSIHECSRAFNSYWEFKTCLNK